MKKYLPKIIAAHDLSGFGKASLTAVIPILSVMGSYVCPLQTAALSTITGVFEGYTFTDLTKHIHATIKHWSELNIKFDYIYSGFLGSPEQVDVIMEAKKLFDCSLIVDPVFADDGELYPTMNDCMVSNMKRLVSVADIITPNITEAMFLLGENKLADDEQEIKLWLKRLCDMGPSLSLITSCRIGDKMYVCAYDSKADKYITTDCRFYPGNFHGTGDVFTTVLTGAIARGQSAEEAIKLAVNFVRHAIEETVENGVNPKEGIVIEKILKDLI